MKLSKSTVQGMIKNDYKKPKKQRRPNKNKSGFELLKFGRSIAALKHKKVKITASKIKKQAIMEVSIPTVHRALHENRYQYKNGKNAEQERKAERVRLCSD